MAFRDLVPWHGNRQNVPIRQEGSSDPIRSLRSQIDQLFDSFWGDFGLASQQQDRYLPSIDISESENELLVKAELPGMDAEDVDISLSENLLTIRGEKREEEEREEGGYRYREIRSGSFHRQIPLPVSVDSEQVRAEVSKGVLSIHLPKAAESKAKRIDVKAA